MFSKTEREYLENPALFEEKNGYIFAKVTRSRVRKRIKEALEGIIYVVQNDKDTKHAANMFHSEHSQLLESLISAYIKKEVDNNRWASPVCTANRIIKNLGDTVRPVVESTRRKLVEKYIECSCNDKEFLMRIEIRDVYNSGFEDRTEALYWIKDEVIEKTE